MLWHFSEDPHIERFTPHVPPTNSAQPPAVWAIDTDHAPLYWFPRDCPRVTVWADDDTERSTLGALLHTAAPRVHATELAWLDRIRTTALYVYRLPDEPFRRWTEAHGQWVSTEPVTPLDVEPVGDLLARHATAGIELRLVPDLGPLRNLILTSGLPFSMVRMRNARHTQRT